MGIYRYPEWTRNVVLGLDLRDDKSFIRRWASDLTGGSVPNPYSGWSGPPERTSGQSGTRFNGGQSIEFGGCTTAGGYYMHGDFTAAVRIRLDKAIPAISEAGLWAVGTAGNETYFPYSDGKAYVYAFLDTRPSFAFDANIPRTEWFTFLVRVSFPRTSPSRTSGPWEAYQQGVLLHSTTGLPGYVATTWPFRLGYTGNRYLHGDVEWFGIWNEYMPISKIRWLAGGRNPFELQSPTVFSVGFVASGPSSGDTTDAALIGDTHTATATAAGAIADAALAADTQAPLATSSVTTSDAGIVADTQVALATVTAATSDAILATDTQAASAVAAATTVDAGLIADTQAAAAAAAVTIADSGLISDTQDGAIGAGTSSATTADAALISVAFSATATVPVNTSDAILVSDNQIATAVASAAITDVALVSDTIVGASVSISLPTTYTPLRCASGLRVGLRCTEGSRVDLRALEGSRVSLRGGP